MNKDKLQIGDLVSGTTGADIGLVVGAYPPNLYGCGTVYWKVYWFKYRWAFACEDSCLTKLCQTQEETK